MVRLLLLCLLIETWAQQITRNELSMGSMDMIAYRGYPAEQHKVVTADGYVLTMHRIPHGRTGRWGGGPVLLQHGLLSSSFGFLSQLPSKALSYSLADAGFDVWLGNNRGNIYSNEHTKFKNPKTNRRYWNFSWHEMSEFDYPAMIDYILNVTQKPNLILIGHSQGALTYIAATTINTKIQSKVKHFFAIAPSLSTTHLGSNAIRIGTKHRDIVEAAMDKIPDHAYSYPALSPICGKTPAIPCKWLFNEFSGPIDDVDERRLPVFTVHAPAGTSNKNLKHWLQQIHNGTKHFDYGVEGNLAAYGTPYPREFDFSTFSVPTSVFFSPSDKLVTNEDIKIGLSRLPAKSIVKIRNITGFGHFEFLWGNRAKAEIYDEIIDDITRIGQQ